MKAFLLFSFLFSVSLRAHRPEPGGIGPEVSFVATENGAAGTMRQFRLFLSVLCRPAPKSGAILPGMLFPHPRQKNPTHRISLLAMQPGGFSRRSLSSTASRSDSGSGFPPGIGGSSGPWRARSFHNYPGSGREDAAPAPGSPEIPSSP